MHDGKRVAESTMGNKLFLIGAFIGITIAIIIYSQSDLSHTAFFKTYIAPLIAVAFVLCLVGRLLGFLEDIVGKKDTE